MKPALIPHRHCKKCGDALKFPLMATKLDKGLYDLKVCKKCATQKELATASEEK